MTKNEYISALGRELKRLGVADAGDVVEEYEQHFAFKSADGCSEEETAARLGDPAVLAAQFAGAGGKESSGALTKLGLGVLWVFAALFFVLLAAWAVVMAAFTLACAACAVCLLTGIGVGGLIPDMPYLCAAVFAVALAALAVLSAVGTVYYLAFVRAVVRSWTRFTHNTLAAARGCAVLPALPAVPRLGTAAARRARRMALVSLAVFAACFVLGAVISMVSAGSIEFWHAWGWFGYGAA